jgi:hypothetical protein
VEVVTFGASGGYCSNSSAVDWKLRCLQQLCRIGQLTPDLLASKLVEAGRDGRSKSLDITRPAGTA